MRRLVVEAEARAEFLEVIAWNTAHHNTEYADRFAKAVSAAFYEIAERPMMWPVTKGDPKTRSRHLRAIRYTVYYRVSATTVMITGIQHMRRQPRSWTNRR